MPERHGCGNTRVSQLICPLDYVTPEDCIACESRENEKKNSLKYYVCCPVCDNKKCVRGTEQCEAEIWAKNKKKRIY